MTDYAQSYENPHPISNENDMFHSPNTNPSDDTLKSYAEEEKNVYSGMPLPTEMHYIPHNNNRITYNEDYNTLTQPFDNITKSEEKKEEPYYNHNQDKLLNEKKNKDLQYDYDNLQEKDLDSTNKSNKDRKIKSQEQKIIDKLQQSLELKENQVQNLEKEKEDLDAKNVNLRSKLEEVIKQNALLKDEASNYQSALGVATSFQLSDDDQNHGVKLTNDISELHDNIKKYITNLKQDVVVNMDEVKKLLLHYKCPTKIKSQKKDRLLIQAVLHRHVIETIFEYASQYFEEPGKHEADIVRNESLLSELLAHTSKCRAGNDEITRVGPTKLRQQIYSILSNRGFANVISSDGENEHPFINSRKEQLNKVMNQLRTIKDNQKKTASDNLAADIIREVVKIFWFRLKVQEPVAEFFWIPQNIKVDPTIMEVNQTQNGDDDDDDDLHVNLYVDLCYFPQIGRDLDTNNQKTYTLAKVITRTFQYDDQQFQEIISQQSRQPQQNQEQPTQPTQSIQPTQPTQSTQPIQPTQSTQPTQPTQSTQPKQKTGKTGFLGTIFGRILK
ncbi:hypothetical protein C1645_744060 [Glomus cerebriforme]|uniref:Uncharacterized protein n=1 Tax=Glomus cerebriforme TaxID=658196 RepID=A0A397S6Q4_9GLOM|nr:hypothetical protein C1645_744060 [Glomus cerebriforme]